MSALKPDTDSTHDLGTSVLRWRNLFVDGITVTDDIVISGNLTVSGASTTLTTQALFVEDPLVKLNRGSTADPTQAGASDQGFVFSRANGGGSADQANRVLLWDESEDEFAFGVSATELGTTAGNVAISAYSDVSLGKLVFNSVAGDAINVSTDLTLNAVAAIALVPGGGDVKITGHVLPADDDTYDLGSASAAWQDIFLQGDITMSDAGTIATTAGDLTLEAEANDAKVVIKGDHEAGIAIHIDGNANAASEVQIDAGILDINVTGAATIDGASLAIGATSIGAVSIDSTAGISLDADTASHMKTAAGDLTLEAEADDAKVVIKGDHETGIAIHLDGNAAAASEVQIDAGILDIDVTGAATIDAGTTIDIESSGGAISIGATAVAQNINIGSGNAARTINVGHAASTLVDVKALDVDIAAGTGGFAVSGGAASSLSTSAGALNITGAAASTFQTLAGALNITGAAASTFQTSAGALTINGTAGLNLQEGGADVITISDDKDVLFSHTGGSTVDPDVEFDGYVRFDGTVELNSTVQVDGATTFNNTLTVGANGGAGGYDVQFFGETNNQYLKWDHATDELVLAGDSKLSFHDAAGGENIIASADGHLEVNAGTTLDMTAPTVDINASTAVTLDTPSMVVSSSTASKPVLELKNTNDDETGPTLKLALDTANSAFANDVAGTIAFFADDSADNNQSYGEIKVVAADVTSDSEKGKMTLGVATTTAGSIEDIITITGGTNASGSIVEIHGSLNILGTTTTVDQGTMLMANSVTFEGSAANEHETKLTVTNPTADRTIILPDLDGYVPLLAGAISNSNVTAAEFALLDGDTARGTTAVADGDGIFTNSNGTMQHTTVQTFQTYFDANSVGGTNIVTVGNLNAGSITSGFTSIDVGAGAISTTGLGSFGSLDVDDVLIDGFNIGCTGDTDLLTLASGALTLKGTLTVGINDAGHNVKLFGATAGSFLQWNEATDSLHLTDDTPLKIGDSQDMTLYHDGTNSHITNTTGTLNIATVAAASGGSTAVNIGNATSTVTMGQDLAVTRNLTAAKATVENIDLDDKTITMTGSTGDTASFVVADNGALSITTVDAAAAAANMTLTADGTFEAVGTTITLDAGGAISLEPGGGATLNLDQVDVVGQAISNVSTLTATTLAGTLSTAAQTNVTSLGTLTGLTVSSADDISLTTTADDGLITLHSEHTAGQAIFIDANAAAGSTLDIDAGVMDVDVQGNYTLDATGISLDSDAASNFTTSSGALTLDGNGGVNIAGNAAEIDITTTGALDINSGATTVDADALSIDSTDTTNLTMTANDNGEKVLTIDAVNSGSGAAKIALGTTSGTAISIGHGTSETTINDNLTITGLTTASANFSVGGAFAGAPFKVFSATGNTVISGDLTVSSALTSNGSNLKIKDSLIVFSSDESANDNGFDVGFVGGLAADDYVGFIYDNSDDRFVLKEGLKEPDDWTASTGSVNTVDYTGSSNATLELGQIYLNDSAEGGDSGVATPLTTHATYWVTAGAETSTLAAGSEGQIKVLAMKTDGGNMVVTVANAAWGGSSTITLSEQGAACTLQYIDSQWYVIGSSPTGVATA